MSNNFIELDLFAEKECQSCCCHHNIDPIFSNIDPFDKMNKAVRLVRSVAQLHNFVCAFSGGKDSVLLQFLIKQAGVKCEYIYNNTTIDPPYTINFVKRQGVIINQPRQTFFSLMKKKGFPTMWRRFCCKEFKEKYIGDYVFLGIRRQESVKRMKRYTSFEACRLYPRKLHSHQIFPLLLFTPDDIVTITDKFSLEHHPLYYDKQGKFDVTRRLGCIGCPLSSDRGKRDFLQYPNFLRQYIKAGVYYYTTHGRTEYDAYLKLVYNIFYSNNKNKQFKQTYHGLFKTDPKAFIESYFHL